jgi:RNA polymerase sigma-70 factor (ECF subfamily)
LDNSKSDEQLVEDIQKGNENSFDILYRKYARRVFNIIVRIVKDRHLAEDIMQEVFVKVNKSINKFKFKSSFYTWLYRIAVNTALTFAKKKSKKKEAELKLDILSHNSSPEKKLDNEYVKRKIENAVNNLPEKQRMIFTLRFYEDLKYNDISKIMNVSENSCKTNFHYAMNNLKEQLGGLL